MTQCPASVVIVSHGRPSELRSCLKALTMQDHGNFELVVVADATGLRHIEDLDLPMKTALFEKRNIAAARNLGIQVAAGDVVAFIDDDAIAEPTWLSRICTPFTNKKVAAAGGFVRGRNGISYQWKAESVNRSGFSKPIEVQNTQLFEGDPDRAIKTHGTNCAFRRSVLIQHGGFDEFYKFFLDETDLNMRLAQDGCVTAVVPDAEVQHGFAASYTRAKDRAPKTLFQIGASMAYFSSKFGGSQKALEDFRRLERKRLIRHVVAGGLEPRDVERLLRQLDDGFATGDGAAPTHFSKIDKKPPSFLPFLTKVGLHKFMSVSWLQRRRVWKRK